MYSVTPHTSCNPSPPEGNPSPPQKLEPTSSAIPPAVRSRTRDFCGQCCLPPAESRVGDSYQKRGHAPCMVAQVQRPAPASIEPPAKLPLPPECTVSFPSQEQGKKGSRSHACSIIHWFINNHDLRCLKPKTKQH